MTSNNAHQQGQATGSLGKGDRGRDSSARVDMRAFRSDPQCDTVASAVPASTGTRSTIGL
jgi:hypothetical protein